MRSRARQRCRLRCLPHGARGLETRVAAAESAANKAAEAANSPQARLQKANSRRGRPRKSPPPGRIPPESPDLGPLNERSWRHRAETLFACSQLRARLLPPAAPKAELRAAPQEREDPAAKQGSRAAGDRDRRGKPVAQAGEWRDVFGRTRGIGKPRRRGGSAYPAARGPSVGRYARKPAHRAICSSRPGDYRDRIPPNRPAPTKVSSTA